MNAHRTNRLLHRWASIAISLPLLIVILSGFLLLFKKESNWIQPPTRAGTTSQLSLSFDQILAISKSVPEAKIKSWDDVNRLDVRPKKGMVKVRAKNRWEIQIDTQTGHILQVAYRRSDLIESLHDGSFFHPNARLWIFFPVAILLLILWLSGIYLFIIRTKKRKPTPKKS